jgi:hypothetical protein
MLLNVHAKSPFHSYNNRRIVTWLAVTASALAVPSDTRVLASLTIDCN